MATEASRTDRPPRRLSREARRRQLIAAAIPLAARQGLALLSLEDLALRTGVTRNLLYHYFPRGRRDVVLAVVGEAERQLGGVEAMLDHALAATHAWRIHRMAAGSADGEVRACVSARTQSLVQALALAHLDEPSRSPVAEVALHGYLGAAEAALDAGRAGGLARAELARLLDRLLSASLEAARQ